MNQLDEDKSMNNQTIKNAINTFNYNKIQSISYDNLKVKNLENGMINVNFKIKMKNGLLRMKNKKNEE